MNFCKLILTGVDAEKFLQGQITCDVKKISTDYQATAICNLKGRVEFGLWLKKLDDSFAIVLSEDCVELFEKHIKKYGAFSKINLSKPVAIFAKVIKHTNQLQPVFSDDNDNNTEENFKLWQQLSIETGNYWITQATQNLWQPQELRLHQRGGVDYDKGCYLGQEIVARLYFKASPKAYLHRVAGVGSVPVAGENIDKISVVNAIATDNGFQALVVARPDDIAHHGLTVLPLPEMLQQPVERH